jgi:hypothetical protein
MGDFKAPAGQQNKIATPVQAPKEASSLGETEYVDSRASTFQFIQLQAAADDQGRGNRITQLQSKSAQFTGFSRVAQLQAKSYSQVSAAQPSVVQREENKTGLPDGLKSGMESISGMSLSDVKVHRNSDKPAQLQALAYAQGTDIHLGPGQEKHLPHELGHVVQQKEGRVKPTVQLKDKVNINDDSGLEKEADVLGQKASSVGKTTEKGSDVGVAQQKGEDVLQGKFTQGSLPQFSKTQPIQLEDDGKAAAAKNNVTKEQIDEVRPLKDKPLEEIKAATGLTNEQIATAQARLFGDVKVLDKQKVDPETGLPVGETPKLRAANPWDKWFINSLSPEDQAQVVAAKAKIPAPEKIFTEEAIAKHLGKFAKGAHAFIDPETSGKIKGTIQDSRFTGWGADANFVAPLGEAEDLHQRALKEKGIITIEEELGIGGFWWSRTDRNKEKQMVRWTIPEPQNFKLEDNQPFLSMATGNETGALVHEWVAGGFTLGGMTEAVVRAIPREQLMKALNSKPPTITSETVVYSKTPYNIGEKGPGTLPPEHENYVPEKDWKW